MDKLSGVVVSAEQTGTTKTGWKNWVAVFEKGESAKFAIPPDSDFQPTSGQTLSLYKGKYGWLLDTSAEKKSSSGGGDGETSSSDYWKNKFEYEARERDPKIEYQTYFREICAVYISAMPMLKPKSLEEVDEWINRAMEKAKEVYQHVQLSKECKE